MNLPSFLLYTALGTAIWSGLLAYGGMVLGNQYQQLSQLVQWATYVVIGLVVVAIHWRFVKRSRQQQES